MTQHDFLKSIESNIYNLRKQAFDVISLAKPSSIKNSLEIIGIISKLSPLVGNLIELRLVEYLNEFDYEIEGSWERQDPGFPDAIFKCDMHPNPGFEIKAWYPLATEITARFKDSQNFFSDNQTNVIALAWLPEYLFYEKPKLIDISILNGLSVAKARDNHYFNPPDYIILEPEDTSTRARNLQQTNTSGYKIQHSKDSKEYASAEKRAKEIGLKQGQYTPTYQYQKNIKQLLSEFSYRLDTNYAKMDRIVHSDLELFKSKVMEMSIFRNTVSEWSRLFDKGTDEEIVKMLTQISGNP